MAEVFETFSTYLARLEKAVPAVARRAIIRGSDIKIPLLRDGDDDSIVKTPVAWPLYKYNMFYTVEVPADKHVAPHKHDEDIFRYVLKGELTINKTETFKAGEWFVIRSGTTYEVDTATGYTTLAGYTSVCRTNRGDVGMHLEVDV